MDATYRIHLRSNDDDTLIAECPALPEVITEGNDREGALAMALDALLEAIAGRMKSGEAIPEGDATARSRHAVTLPSRVAAKVEVYRAMQAEGVRKSELARRLKVHRPEIDRLLSLGHGTAFDKIDAAMRALGRTLVVSSRKAA